MGIGSDGSSFVSQKHSDTTAPTHPPTRLRCSVLQHVGSPDSDARGAGAAVNGRQVVASQLLVRIQQRSKNRHALLKGHALQQQQQQHKHTVPVDFCASGCGWTLRQPAHKPTKPTRPPGVRPTGGQPLLQAEKPPPRRPQGPGSIHAAVPGHCRCRRCCCPSQAVHAQPQPPRTAAAAADALCWPLCCRPHRRQTQTLPALPSGGCRVRAKGRGGKKSGVRPVRTVLCRKVQCITRV